MANAFAKFGISDDDLKKHIRKSAEVDAGINRFMKDEVIPYGRSVSPVDEGAYAASWKIMQKAKNGRGLVGPKDFKAHWIEYGTAAPGPTKAYAPAEKTARHFGGDLKGGIKGGDDE